ncbi:MAG: ABC transporter substrate-binding protein [Thermosulfidibacteraceae bacterium]
MYVEKGWYPQEEEAKKWLATFFKKETGISIELTSLSQQDLLNKINVTMVAGNPPEIAWSTIIGDFQADFSWKGWYEDVGEFVDTLKSLDTFDWVIKAMEAFDGTQKKRIYAFLPIAGCNIPIHYWKDLLEMAGMPSNPNEIPTTSLDKLAQFFREAQDKLWQKDPSTKGKVYGIGWPSLGGIGSLPGDGLQQMIHIMLWYGWKPLTEQGDVVMDSSENISAFAEAVEFVTSNLKGGYSPLGMLEWGSPDNNSAFNAKNIISVFNGTMSIPLYWYGQDKAVYFDKTATLPQFPGAVMWELLGWGLFRQSKNKELAKKFIKWFLQPDIINQFLKASGGRYCPTSRAVLEMDSFWRNGYSTSGKKDPHLPTVYEMLINGKNNIPHIYHWFGHPWGYQDAYVLAAVHRVMKDGLTPLEAAKEATTKWMNVIKEYRDQIKKW